MDELKSKGVFNEIEILKGDLMELLIDAKVLRRNVDVIVCNK